MTDDIPEFLRRKKNLATAAIFETATEPVPEDDLIGGAPEPELEPEIEEHHEDDAEEPAKVSGHNKCVAGFTAGQLRSVVERVESLEEEKKTIAADIKEVYAEAKANGFDAKIIRKVVAIRKREKAEREEEEALLDTYMMALGMI